MIRRLLQLVRNVELLRGGRKRRDPSASEKTGGFVGKMVLYKQETGIPLPRSASSLCSWWMKLSKTVANR